MSGFDPENQAKGLDCSTDYRPSFHKFYDLMRYKVNNILLVSSLYDAFTLEEDGLLNEQLSGKYSDLELTSPPQIVRVASGEEALNELRVRNYDLVITMSKLVDLDPFEFGRKAKNLQPGVPVILLVTEAEDLPAFHNHENNTIDKVFFWTGETSLFFAITKYIEDRVNVEKDTQTGYVSVILMIEDSPRFYSMYLPILYTEVMVQTQRLAEEALNDHEKMFRKRARAKILLADCYEEGMALYEQYKDHLLSIITDVSYPHQGIKEEGAGFNFIKAVDPSIPVLVQSSDSDYMSHADALGVPFLDKKSDKLLKELSRFFRHNLGFGDFIFRSADGEEVARAKDMKSFEEMVNIVDPEVLKYHSERNDFSNWLRARGEIELSDRLKPKKFTDYKNAQELREHLIASIHQTRKAKQAGVITDFSQQDFEFEGTFTRLGSGSLGGKGRGLGFLTMLLNQSDLEDRIDNCKVRVPDTLAIGTNWFDEFMEINELDDYVQEEHGDEEIAQAFLAGELPEKLGISLRSYLKQVNWPLAVRSSSLLEDSQNQPFAGIYCTYILPNNCEEEETRFQQLVQAIKLVYASTYYERARSYFQTTVHTSEEEKMGILIQRLVGNRHGDRFYPIFSGLAQSYNFYPVPPLKREGGVANMALGLGKIVVEGEKVLSFSPSKPNIIPGFSNTKAVLNNSQNHFYALNMLQTCFDLSQGEDVTLLSLDITKAEEDGTLDMVASTYDPNDNRIRDGAGGDGPKVITFSGILQYDAVPVVGILSELLEIGRKWMGRHIEIEFAGSLDDDGNPEFSILQIRPLVTMKERNRVSIEEKEKESSLLWTDIALGNGTLQNIRDMILVPPETFDNTKTLEIAKEIGELNSDLKGKPYMLVGPGRWGTRDRFLGIPVEWNQISGARAIAEVGLKDLAIDPSQGTHFFHNMTSLGIMYFTVPANNRNHIDWSTLGSAEVVNQGKYVKHMKFPRPLEIKVDGSSGKGLVRLPKEEP